jgi:hypothetical protein
MSKELETPKGPLSVKRVPLLEALRMLSFTINVSADTREWPEAGKDLVMVSSMEMRLLENTFEWFRALDDLAVYRWAVTKDDVYYSLWTQLEICEVCQVMPAPDGPEKELRGRLIKWLLSFIIYMYEGWGILKARYYRPTETVDKYDVIGRYLLYFSEMVIFNLPKTGLTEETIKREWGDSLGPTYNVVMDLLVHLSAWSFENKPVVATLVVFTHIWDILVVIINRNSERFAKVHIWTSPLYKCMTYNPFDPSPLDDFQAVLRKL